MHQKKKTKEYQKVKSSNIDGVNYDETNKSMYVQFKDDSVYLYHNVPKFIYDKFLTSESKRKFLNEHIHGKHIHRKLIGEK